jgi:hypothetical protein
METVSQMFAKEPVLFAVAVDQLGRSLARDGAEPLRRTEVDIRQN